LFCCSDATPVGESSFINPERKRSPTTFHLSERALPKKVGSADLLPADACSQALITLFFTQGSPNARGTFPGNPRTSLEGGDPKRLVAQSSEALWGPISYTYGDIFHPTSRGLRGSSTGLTPLFRVSPGEGPT